MDVNKEDGDESYDYEDDLPAGCKTRNVKLPQVPDDDGHVAVEGCADQHEDSGHQEITLKSVLLCVSLAIERFQNCCYK